MKDKEINLSEVLNMPDQKVYFVANPIGCSPKELAGRPVKEYVTGCCSEFMHEVFNIEPVWTYVDSEWLLVTTDMDFKEFEEQMSKIN